MHHNDVCEDKSLKYFIKYRGAFYKKYGCKHTALLVEQLEYWFSKKNFKNGFYKFIEPCKHHFYKPDDSWTEVLNISRRTFIRCFNKIGIRYTSKSQFQNTLDKFKGHTYAYYYDRKTNQTFFVKNNPNEISLSVVDRIPQVFSPSQSTSKLKCGTRIAHENTSTLNFTLIEDENNHISSSSKDLNHKNTTEKNAFYEYEEKFKILNKSNTDLNTSCHIKDNDFQKRLQKYHFKNLPFLSQDIPLKLSHFLKNSHSSTWQNAHSNERVYINNIYYNHKSLSIFKEKDFKKELQNKNILIEKALGHRMIDIWQQSIGDTGLSYQPVSLLINLHQVLEKNFEGSLFNWLKYCQKIASSKFLMGEGKAWCLKKAYLLWAIQSHNIHKITSGVITTGDRKKVLDVESLELNKKYIQLQQEIKAKKLILDEASRYVARLRHQAVIEEVQHILASKTSLKFKNYQQQFEEMILNGNPEDINWPYARCAQSFDITKWQKIICGRGMMSPMDYFERFVSQILADQHFGKTNDEMIAIHKCKIETEIKVLQLNLEKMNYMFNFYKNLT